MSRPDAEPGARADDGGYVSLAVLVVTGLLAVVVTSMLMVSRPALGLARVGFDELAADSLVEGGFQAAGYLLFLGERDFSEVDGSVLRFDNGNARISVLDEGGRIDLNGADPALLSGLYTAAGASGMRPDAFAARIVDWRDQDSDLTEGGAEANEYGEDSYLPSDAPFRSVEELRMLYGLSGEDFARVAPFLTVYNPMAGVDPLSAPSTVLRAVPGLSRADVQRLITAREEIRDREQLIALLSQPSEFLQSEASGVYRVAVAAEIASGFAAAAEAVLIASADGSAPYGVVDWSRLEPEESAE